MTDTRARPLNTARIPCSAEYDRHKHARLIAARGQRAADDRIAFNGDDPRRESLGEGGVWIEVVRYD